MGASYSARAARSLVLRNFKNELRSVHVRPEIHATNEVSKLLMGIHDLAKSIRNSGFAIPDTTATSPLYNDNESCVRWSHNITTKQIVTWK